MTTLFFQSPQHFPQPLDVSGCTSHATPPISPPPGLYQPMGRTSPNPTLQFPQQSPMLSPISPSLVDFQPMSPWVYQDLLHPLPLSPALHPSSPAPQPRSPSPRKLRQEDLHPVILKLGKRMELAIRMELNREAMTFRVIRHKKRKVSFKNSINNKKIKIICALSEAEAPSITSCLKCLHISKHYYGIFTNGSAICFDLHHPPTGEVELVLTTPGDCSNIKPKETANKPIECLLFWILLSINVLVPMTYVTLKLCKSLKNRRGLIRPRSDQIEMVDYGSML